MLAKEGEKEMWVPAITQYNCIIFILQVHIRKSQLLFQDQVHKMSNIEIILHQFF